MSRAVRSAIVLAGLFGFANLTACSAKLDTPPADDVAAPAVSITSPASGATVSGPIAVTASASDDVGVGGVQFKRDDANLDAEDLTEPYAVTLDPTTLANGSYTLTAVARDAAGNTSVSAPVTITVENPADTQAPSVPTGLTGTAVSSNQINLTWNASTDNVRVVGYSVYLNDVALAETADTSFSHTNLTAGTTYNYRVSAYDEVPNHSAWTASVPVTTPGATGATLLFKSGFEGNTTLGPLADLYSTGAWQDISGTDSGSGFTWPPTIWGGTGRFQLIADEPVTSTALPGYMVNELQTVTGRGGTSTRALYSTVLKSVGGANQNTVATQNVFHVLPGAAGQGDLYVSYWLKFQPDLLGNMTVNNWAGRVVTDWKTGGDYRIVFSVYGDRSNNRLYWNIKGDNVANGGLPQQIFWDLSNTAVPVPVGQWFRVEIFVHRSGGTGGRVWVAVNGQQLFDRLGSNMGINNLPWNRIMPFLNYSSYALLPAYQWVDDVELWDGFPSTASPH